MVKLTVASGPQQGTEFEFERHDTFLVGRVEDAQYHLPDDPRCSRRHFLLEVNPPRCRLINLSGRSGTLLNGMRVQSAEAATGDEISAGPIAFKLSVVPSKRDGPKSGSLPLDRPAAPPSHIPGYRIEAPLGRGSAGVVYRATREKDGLPVAIKVITPVPGTNGKAIARFLREVSALPRLEHPNVVAVHEMGEANGVAYVVMELVTGRGLDVRLRDRGPAEVSTAVRIVCQALAGLGHAHERCVAHGDIKLANILISEEGTKRVAKLAGFGLSRAIDESRLRGTSLLGEWGTTAYLAPERVKHYGALTATSDQYAAGVALYKLLTGQYPHDLPDDAPGQVATIATLEPVRITQRRPDVPAILSTVIHTALSYDPALRFPNVLAFRRSLKMFA